jgi:hypothetical protein
MQAGNEAAAENLGRIGFLKFGQDVVALILDG